MVLTDEESEIPQKIPTDDVATKTIWLVLSFRKQYPCIVENVTLRTPGRHRGPDNQGVSFPGDLSRRR